MPSSLELLVSNISGKPQIKQLDGRDHLVVPMTMIVPGVLNGSKGRGLYKEPEITREMDAWNNMPIVVNHPVDSEGNAISARSPDVLDKHGIGRVFNARYKGKLQAMAWIDTEKALKLVPNEYAKLKQGKAVELSTGVFTREEPIRNGKTDDGKDYDWEAKDIKPDHLALLTSSKGACSLNDGCGLNVNQEAELVSNDELAPYVDWDEIEMIDPILPVDNQLSHNDLREQLRALVRKQYGSSASIQDVFDKTVVYSLYEREEPTSPMMDSISTEKSYEVSYTTDLRTGKVTLGDSPKEVIRETKYKPVSNSQDKPWYELLVTNGCSCKGECQDCKDKIENAELSSNKACQILKDGEVNGKPITNKQRRIFGMMCSKQIKHNQLTTNSLQGDDDMKTLTKEQKEKIVSDLIANEGVGVDGPWTAEDKDALFAMPEPKLIALNEQRELLVNAMSDDDDEEEDEEDEEGDGKPEKGKIPPQFLKKNKKAANNSQVDEGQIVANWLGGLGVAATKEQAASVLRNAIAFEQKQRDQFTKVITANSELTKKWCDSQDLPVLEHLSKKLLVDNEQDGEEGNLRQPSYLGAGGQFLIGNAQDKDFRSQNPEMGLLGLTIPE